MDASGNCCYFNQGFCRRGEQCPFLHVQPPSLSSHVGNPSPQTGSTADPYVCSTAAAPVKAQATAASPPSLMQRPPPPPTSAATAAATSALSANAHQYTPRTVPHTVQQQKSHRAVDAVSPQPMLSLDMVAPSMAQHEAPAPQVCQGRKGRDSQAKKDEKWVMWKVGRILDEGGQEVKPCFDYALHLEKGDRPPCNHPCPKGHHHFAWYGPCSQWRRGLVYPMSCGDPYCMKPELHGGIDRTPGNRGGGGGDPVQALQRLHRHP